VTEKIEKGAWRIVHKGAAQITSPSGLFFQTLELAGLLAAQRAWWL
jgi:hypothetical protein